MAKPLFVLDKRYRPLLPPSRGYTGALVRQGKAQVLPHHAFSIVHLTQRKPEPKFPPIVLGVALSDRTAELMVCTEDGGKVRLLLRLLVDLQPSVVEAASSPDSTGARRRRYRGARARFTHVSSARFARGWSLLKLRQAARERVDTLFIVTAALCQLAPISHVVVTPITRARTNTQGQAHVTGETASLVAERMLEARVQHLVVQTLFRRLAAVGIERYQMSETSLPSMQSVQELDTMLSTWVRSAHARRANLVALVVQHDVALQQARDTFAQRLITRRQQRNQPSSGHRTKERLALPLSLVGGRPEADIRQPITPGDICELHLEEQPLLGIARSVDTQHVVLRIPVHTHPAEIAWQDVTVPATAPLRLISRGPLAFLPVAQPPPSPHHGEKEATS